MRYIGSKTSVVGDIHSLVAERIPEGSFCDPYGGIGTVGSYFKARNYRVYSGDHLTFAHYFQMARIALNTMPRFRVLRDVLSLDHHSQITCVLNGLKCRSGWLVQNYVRRRKFFTPENGGRIEACRQMIRSWYEKGWLTYKENALLVASLINSMDKVANTAGTYYAHLKSWHRKAARPFSFAFLPQTRGNPSCRCLLSDAASLVRRRQFDILYLDPPHNERRYASYYHLPESIALGETPKVKGKAGVPIGRRQDSAFNRKREAPDALAEILHGARFRLLVFHYSDNGIIPRCKIRKLLSDFGMVDEYFLDCAGYTNKSGPRNVRHRLYFVEP